MSASQSQYVLVQLETMLIKRSVVNALRVQYSFFFQQGERAGSAEADLGEGPGGGLCSSFWEKS